MSGGGGREADFHIELKMRTDYKRSERELDAWKNEGAHLETLQVPWGLSLRGEAA